MKSLTSREIEILRMLWDGSSTKDIARTLELSTKTVETHRAHISRKSGIPGANLMLVVRWGLAQGYLELPAA